MLSLNLYRRQLNVAQRALIAAEISSLRNQKASGVADPSLETLQLNEASKLMAVSARTVSSACKVVREGAEELLLAVRNGGVSVSAAELVCRLPKTEQQVLCEKGVKAIARAARKIREDSKAPARERADGPKATPPTGPAAQQDTQQPRPTGKCSAQRVFELAKEAMELGYEAETLVLQILDEVEDGLDIQLLLFTAEAMVMLQPKLKLQARQKYS